MTSHKVAERLLCLKVGEAQPLTESIPMIMKMVLATCVAVAMAATAAQSQPAQSGPGNNAVNSPDTKNSNRPVAGSNSFTEGQVKSRIEEAGYGNVTGMKKDDSGVWRGKATKGGITSNVSVDFQGNVNAAK